VVDKAIHVGAEIVSGFSESFDLSQTDELSQLSNKEKYRGQVLQVSATMGESAPLFLYEGEVSGTKIKPKVVAMGDEMDDEVEGELSGEESMNEEDFDLDEDDEDENKDNDMSDATASTTSASSSTHATSIEVSLKKKGAVPVSTKQDLYDEADDLNPQLNQAKRKQLKNKKKKQKKAVPSRDDPDVYNFATDFRAEDGDIDFNEIDG